MNASRCACGAIAALATACGSPGASTTVSPSASTAVATAPPAPSASAPPEPPRAGCPAVEPSFTPTGDYRHKRTRLLVQSQGSPRHAASDVAVAVGKPARLRGKFVYGKAGKDLEDEEISLFVRDESCTWRGVGSAFTDDDGWVTLEAPETLTADPGIYAFQLVVRGDGSRAGGNIYALAPGTPTAVFDVDATLTTSDRALFDQIAEGTVPEARPNGNEIAHAVANGGSLVVYLTGRPYFLHPLTRTWLTSHGFPDGMLRTTESLSACAPTPEGVGAYKEAALAELKAAGAEVRLAYGNALTDICAYAKSGIDPRRTFIIGPHAGNGCDGFAPAQALLGYRDHVGRVPDLMK